jgi:hypothetical protein
MAYTREAEREYRMRRYRERPDVREYMRVASKAWRDRCAVERKIARGLGVSITKAREIIKEESQRSYSRTNHHTAAIEQHGH